MKNMVKIIVPDAYSIFQQYLKSSYDFHTVFFYFLHIQYIVCQQTTTPNKILSVNGPSLRLRVI